MIFTLQRQGETANSTYGTLSGPNGPLCKILERGPRNPDHPRIPAGTYRISRKPLGTSEFDKSFSALIGPSYKGVLWVTNVPGRTNIEIHTANTIEQLLGCLCTGLSIGHDPHGDYMVPGGQSSPAMKTVYMAISPQIDLGAADLVVKDIASPAGMV